MRKDRKNGKLPGAPWLELKLVVGTDSDLRHGMAPVKHAGIRTSSAEEDYKRNLKVEHKEA
jgi:hypothetical protein